MTAPEPPPPAPAAPPGHWHATPPTPLRTGLRLLLPLVGIAALLAMVLGVFVAALRWTVATEDGTRWLLRHLPGVEATGFSGALLGPAWHLDRLRVSWNSGRDILVIDDLGASGLRWRAWPVAHAWIGFEIAGVTARSAALTTGNGPSTAPFVLPDSIAPPLALRVAHAHVESLTVNGGAPLTAIDLQGLTLDPRPGAEHGVQRFSFSGAGVEAEGAARIGNRKPLALAAQLSLRPALDGDHPRWAAALRADGPLAKLTVTGTLRGTPRPDHAAPTLDLHAVLQPLLPWSLASLALHTDNLDLSALSAQLPSTRLAGDALLSGGEPGQPLVATVALRNAAPGRWDEGRLPAQHLSLRAERAAAQPTRLLVSQFDVEFADATKAAGRWSGSALWQGPTLSLQTRLEGVAPQRLDGRAAAMSLDGPLTVALRGLPAPDGSIGAAALAVDWKLDLGGRLDAAPQPVRLQLEGSADEDHLLLRHAKAQSGGASADLQASLVRGVRGAWQLQSAGTVRDFDPRPWWPGEPGSAWRKGPHRLQGDWQFDFRVPGDAVRLPVLALVQRLAGNGRLHIHDAVLAGVPLAADIKLGYIPAATPAPGSLDADVTLGGNRLLIEGRGDPAGSGANDRWRARIDAADLTTLAPLARLSPELADWVARQGSITGTLAANGRWPALHTEGNLQLSQLQVGTLSLARGSAAWAMNLQGERPLALQIDLAGLQYGQRRADNVRAQLHGTLADHHIDISGALPVLPPAIAVRMLGIEAQSGTQAQLRAQGSWQADAAGGGRWRAHVEQLVIGSWDGGAATTPPASGWIETRDLRAELQFDAGGSLVALHADPGRLQLSDTASLRWDAVSLDLHGEQPQGELHASIDAFALAPLLARAQPGVGWEGDLRLEARVDIRATDKVDADLVFERSGGDLDIASDAGLQLMGLTDFHLQLSVHDGLWQFSQTFRGRSLGEIVGQVQVQTTPDRRWPPADAPLQGSLQAHVADLGIWGSWVPPGWRLSGELSTMATLGGRFGQPQYSGRITGTGLGVRNLLQGVNLHDGKLSAVLEGDTARIEHFTLRGGDGEAEVTGGATLGLSPHAGLQFKADHFRVLGRADRQIVASGNATLDLDADQTRLIGQFGIDEGLYDTSHADAPSLDDDVTVRRPGAAETGGPAAAPAPRRNVALDVTVDLGQKMHVLGRGLETELRGQVRMTTPGGRLAVNGTIRTDGGTYAAYGQNLEIERGIVAFGGVADNPRLDILALRPNLDVRVGLQITGNLQTPRVRLYSEPDMADSDKLSWLLLGRAPDSLGRNDAAMVQQVAVALLAGEGKAPTEVLLHSLGIDQLSLRQSDTDVHETVISLGKQISRNWYLGYERGVNATAGNWQLIYRIAQRFTLRLQSGLDNSADVIWSWRFQAPPAEAAVRKSTVVPP